jgi:hypothetical protein
MYMFFYLHCGRIFKYLQGARTKRCLIICVLCGDPQNNFGPHKVPRHTEHISTSARVTPLADHTRQRRWVLLRAGQCLLCSVSSLRMLVEVWAGLPTGLNGRGSFFHSLPRTTAGRVAIGHPICIVNMPHVTIVFPHICWLYRISVFIAIKFPSLGGL